MPARRIKRVGSVIGLPPENVAAYRKAHDEIWPEIADLIRECGIRNYSIFYRDGLLFSYFEYVGENFEEDMKRMTHHPINQKWWDFVKPFQKPLENREPGEWWSELEPVFFLE